MAGLLDILVKGGIALLATWLGLVVLTRAPRHPGARVFATIAALLVGWSVAILIQRLSARSDLVDRPLQAVEDVTAYVLPALVLHISLSLAAEGRRSSAQQAALALAYGVCIAAALAAVVFPDQRLTVTPPRLEIPGLPGATLGWAWIAARVLILVAALYWIGRGLAGAGDDAARRRVLRLTLATVGVAALGAVLRLVPATSAAVPWLGDSVLGLALVLAAYGVFSQGVFLGAATAGYAFRYSVVVGLGVMLYVATLIGLDELARSMLGLDLPILLGLALVATLALFEPVTAWARREIRGRSAGEIAYDRLLRALGRDVLTAQRPEAVIVPALARLTQTFELLGATVETSEGVTIARHGRPVANSPLALRLPLRTGEGELGSVTFGPKRSLLPFTREESDLLSQGGAYLAASLQLAKRQDVAAEVLESLSIENVALEARGGDLKDALAVAQGAETGLQIFALGPLRVERDGAPLHHWGGAKAGTRHAEGLFAFLFDRGERGAGKDEVIELIWPDVDLERADLAFHRTLGGLRTTLEPGRRGGNRGGAITFYNDRYRLAPSVVAWSDVRAFDEAMAGSTDPDPDEAVRHLERARALYRGDYLDDCPFYGDSAQAEERRSLLRGRYVDLLLALGERYERRGDRPAAAESFRAARSASDDALPGADAALARLSAAG